MVFSCSIWANWVVWRENLKNRRFFIETIYHFVGHHCVILIYRLLLSFQQNLEKSYTFNKIKGIL
ncbi:hypothetical protein L901_08900 [Agrobacterium sp. D14]|nr:hypothetical protein L901_08900 [Agrobacterium sp. D14]